MELEGSWLILRITVWQKRSANWKFYRAFTPSHGLLPWMEFANLHDSWAHSIRWWRTQNTILQFYFSCLSPPKQADTHWLLLVTSLHLFTDAGGGKRMFESGAVPSQDGAGWGSDGEGLAAAPHEEPQSQHQLDPALSSRPASRSFSPPLRVEGSAKIIKGNRNKGANSRLKRLLFYTLICWVSRHVTLDFKIIPS